MYIFLHASSHKNGQWILGVMYQVSTTVDTLDNLPLQKMSVTRTFFKTCLARLIRLLNYSTRSGPVRRETELKKREHWCPKKREESLLNYAT